MIPHHQNAVNMAKALMKHHPDEVAAVDDFGGLLMDIVNGQNYQIHQFRAYLEENPSDRFCKEDYKFKFITENSMGPVLCEWTELPDPPVPSLSGGKSI